MAKATVASLEAQLACQQLVIDRMEKDLHELRTQLERLNQRTSSFASRQSSFAQKVAARSEAARTLYAELGRSPTKLEVESYLASITH